MTTTMMVSIDRAGRLVVPKPIREEMGIGPDTRLRITVRGGRIEIEPVYAEIRCVGRDGLQVAELVEPLPPLPESAVRRTRERLREDR